MAQDRPLNTAELVSVLDWYRAAGVDIAVGEEPVNRFAQRPPVRTAEVPAPISESRPSVQPGTQPSPAPQQPAYVTDPGEARTLAATAQNLAELEAIVGAYDGCGLKLRATQLCFADGNPQARIMLIGEAPGAEEDRQGKPFVGKSGQLLDRMLGAIGLDRTKVYIANTVPWRPPGNRTPTPEELAICLPFLHRQVELVAPQVILTLGGPAMQTVFNTSIGILKMRGRWSALEVGNHSVEAMPTLHPAYLLRNPAAKEQAWRDMLSLKQKIDALGIG
jgi:DNA polymerase